MNPAEHTPSDLKSREQFVPGYGTMLRMAAQLLAERIGERGTVLVLGAGGGLEIEAFSRLAPRWAYLAVDPDQTMLDAARQRLGSCGAADKVSWIEGHIFDAPNAPCDAGVCLLTLHFVPDEEKLGTLAALRARLRRDAPFVLVDLCIDKVAADYDLRLDRYYRFAVESGADSELAASTRDRVRDVIATITPDREEALIRRAGFHDAELFYAGLSWRGWLARA